jgi:uncharacterized protein (TIGR04222 family)
MTFWIVFTVIVGVAGVGAGVAVWLSDLRPGPERAHEAAGGLERSDLAVLCGGPARLIDTTVVDLTSRGLVHASHGALTVSHEMDRLLDTPMDSPGYRPSFTDDEAMMLVAVRAAGRGGLDAVRREALGWDARVRAHGLAERGLLVTPVRRKWAPMIVAGPTLLGLFLGSMGLMTAGPLDEIEWPLSITIMAWLPVTLLAALAYTRRPGYHGRDPRTRLGRAVAQLAQAHVAATATQADRVATGGFAGMTDGMLRAAVQGDAAESRWNIRGRVGAASDVNALVAAQSLDLGGGADGGGGGD